jgi:signal transduction histidine kinase
VTQHLECRSVHGVDSDFVKDARIKVGEGIAGYVAQHGEPLVLNDDDVQRKFAASKKTGRNITSALCIPLMVKGRAIGVLNIKRIDRDRSFSVGDARILAVFGEHAAIAIERVEEYRALDSRASLLEDANRRLAEVNRMKEIFLYTVSHELKTPLTCIIAYAEFLRQDENAIEPEQRKTFSRILYDQANRLLELVNDIMDLSRLEGGAARLNLAPSSLNSIVESSIQTLETQAVRKGIRLTQELAEEVPAIPVDASKLRQVIVNLLNNAIKFTETGGVITIHTRIQDANVVVEVVDSGIGIPARDLTRIFDLFARSDIAVNRQYEGLGLGLHLVKRLVELHGGRVWVESTPGQGQPVLVQPADGAGGPAGRRGCGPAGGLCFGRARGRLDERNLGGWRAGGIGLSGIRAARFLGKRPRSHPRQPREARRPAHAPVVPPGSPLRIPRCA